MRQILSSPEIRFSETFRRHYEERRARLGEGLGPPDVTYAPDRMHPNPLGAGVAARGIKAILDRDPDLLK